MAKIIFLGTSGAVASEKRDNTSFLIQTDELILIDTPGSLVSKLAKIKINFYKISKIFFTHSHPDHLYGIVSFLHSQYKLNNKVDIYGSLKVIKLIKNLRKIFSLENTKLYPKITFHTLNQPNFTFYASRDLSVSFFRAKHSPDAVGFKIFFKNERKTVIISGDSAFNNQLIKEAQNCDFLIHDCFCPYRFFKKYPQLYKKHTSSLQLGKIASLCKTKTLIPIHFSSELKYNFLELIREIKRNYPGKLIVPKDLMSLNI
ncbi:MAG: MBL fold metallo-hydrolase [Candidatus Omnitrophica bacterium]|nr:MBL fold metallo-hydrolase [Candidatus Omnitrophota bacterium]MCM8799711.1 MBL fold metallo-hydrolase [Candidatus Omnitrophota bacterium]